MKKEQVKVKCIGMDERGKGIVKVRGQRIHVPNLIEGETAVVEIIQRKNFKEVKVVQILEKSKYRVVPDQSLEGQWEGCQLQHLSNEGQAEFKQKMVERLLKPYGKVSKILTMDDPYHYRNKVISTVAYNQKREIISGIYEENTHRVIPVTQCMIHNKQADKIISTIRKIAKTYKMQPYNEDARQGFLRHILIRTGFATKEVMVVLVVSNQIFPGKKNFIKELLKVHPEITTIVMNINNRQTSVVLGDKEQVLYGKGYIEDILCERVFQISAKSFYQINPIQTEVLYGKAIEMAKLKGNEVVLDAYCGIGTISLIVSDKVKEVIGVEVNKEAVKDAIKNAKRNKITNAYFHQEDAGEFMVGLAKQKQTIHTVFMDPPRGGSDQKFLSSLVRLSPKQIVYISCNPTTQERDLRYLTKQGYKVREIQPVDMFPQTVHVESIILMTYCGSEAKQ
ncbi:23S rRNA (uracil(1939)-C(5))-methyltransferase RlmD [Irregularibacter muris]|uniref:23S rRNA (Uracil(1939)-C(5))-methyltransferase RlmD n=1 Tax=Irregularibacter muris TaxID=1796619 RepID=A0AAE3HCV7_9FIRM|nr:23S rRNA (uracil(1939)-C(5))-methyltransferase RlmD [Irregularibacter muris]MCR1897431.1 23S rRNA (uracil(1939)-C(5))-methyltransferase RlmD [Irregularibacter muris]